MSQENRKYIIEAALFASAEPLSAERLQQLFDGRSRPSIAEVETLLTELKTDYEERGIDLNQVASGYRFQAKHHFSPWLRRLWEKKPPRYSRALLETLALIAYRQPISRGEIEEIRGVAVSTDIMKKLLEREWIKVIGHRDVPGKPALFGTTKRFLDYFNLTSLGDLPALQDIVDLEKIEERLSKQLALSVDVEPDMDAKEQVESNSVDKLDTADAENTAANDE